LLPSFRAARGLSLQPVARKNDYCEALTIHRCEIHTTHTYPNTHTYTATYTHTYTDIHTPNSHNYTHTGTHTTHTTTHTHPPTDTHAHNYTHTHHTELHTRTHLQTHNYTHPYTDTYNYTHTNTHTHNYTHTHTLLLQRLFYHQHFEPFVTPYLHILKLKLQYSEHLIQRANSLEMTLMLGKIEGKRRKR